MESGIYLVTLNTERLISVNANDPRIAEECIKVNRDNCKFGKAKNLENRRKNYFKTFGKENVNFVVLATLENIEMAERAKLIELEQFRIRGSTGRKNEWLEGIAPSKVVEIVFSTLGRIGLPFQRIYRSE